MTLNEVNKRLKDEFPGRRVDLKVYETISIMHPNSFTIRLEVDTSVSQYIVSRTELADMSYASARMFVYGVFSQLIENVKNELNRLEDQNGGRNTSDN